MYILRMYIAPKIIRQPFQKRRIGEKLRLVPPSADYIADCFDVREQRVTRVLNAGHRTLPGFLVAYAACIANDYGNVAQIGSVTHGWFDADFHLLLLLRMY
jgi:hypothetical protein